MNCVFLPDQRHRSLQENRPPEIISSTDHPYKNGAALQFTGYSSIPSLPVFSSDENPFSPTVVDAEVIYFFNTNSYRVNRIIQAISIGSKGSGNKYGRFYFIYSYSHISRVSATCCITYYQ